MFIHALVASNTIKERGFVYYQFISNGSSRIYIFLFHLKRRQQIYFYIKIMYRSSIFCLILFLLPISCRQNQGNNEENPPVYICDLVLNDKRLSFDLDSETRYHFRFIYTFTDQSGKEYFTFLNYETNQILFYDFKTQDFLFKFEMPREGMNGIPLISGYYSKDFDNLYVTSYAVEGIMRIDTSATIVQTIRYGETKTGYKVISSYIPSSCSSHKPIVFDGSKMYITQRETDHLYPMEKTPLSVFIDTISQEATMLPLTFEHILERKYLYGTNGYSSDFSRAFDGKQFIYSFESDHWIYTSSFDGLDVRKVKAKSRYIDRIKVEKRPDDTYLAVKRNLELPRYGDLIYDPYREVYYRFAHPEVEEDPALGKYLRRSLFGRKAFSVIILNKDLDIIGETLFPEAIYNCSTFFVHKDGLYISADYQINYEQSDDQLTFHCFEVKKQLYNTSIK